MKTGTQDERLVNRRKAESQRIKHSRAQQARYKNGNFTVESGTFSVPASSHMHSENLGEIAEKRVESSPILTRN